MKAVNYSRDEVLPGSFQEFQEAIAPTAGPPKLTLARYEPSKYLIVAETIAYGHFKRSLPPQRELVEVNGHMDRLVVEERLSSGRVKSFSLIDCISVGVDRMQRNFAPMRKQVEAWQRSELTDITANVVISGAFVEGKLEAPKHLACAVHDLYFEPKYEEFRPRTIWRLSNAFTSAFKELDPIPQFKATAKLGEFLEARFSQAF